MASLLFCYILERFYKLKRVLKAMSKSYIDIKVRGIASKMNFI